MTDLRKAAEQEADDERVAALRTLDYCHGLKAGWNFCVANDEAGFERAMASTSEAVRILKKQPAPAQPWVGLKDEEIEAIDGVEMKYIGTGEYVIEGEYEFAKAVEAKLKEKNT